MTNWFLVNAHYFLSDTKTTLHIYNPKLIKSNQIISLICEDSIQLHGVLQD